MEQFDLSLWLQDKSRKVVTRDGREVTIEKTDIHIHGMSHMILGKYNDIYEIWHSNGRINYIGSDCNLDLFFADEEKELTEFEQELRYWIGQSLCNYENNGCVSDNMSDSVNIYLEAASKKLLDLARKEIEKENSEFKPKFTYNEKDYSELANKLIEFRNNTPLCSVSYRDGEGRKIILHYEKEITDLVKEKILKEFPKWKKVDSNPPKFQYNLQGTRLYKDGEYYIELSELETLPKE